MVTVGELRRELLIAWCPRDFLPMPISVDDQTNALHRDRPATAVYGLNTDEIKPIAVRKMFHLVFASYPKPGAFLDDDVQGQGGGQEETRNRDDRGDVVKGGYFVGGNYRLQLPGGSAVGRNTKRIRDLSRSLA
jgi:hypothetical protein